MKPKYLEILEELNISIPEDLLKLVFTHRSFDEVNNNERLEFLGDAVVGLVVAESLYKINPPLSEGDMSKYKAKLISRRHLADIALKLDIKGEMRVGGGEDLDRGRERYTILGNALEALVGAIFVGEGLDKARRFLERVFSIGASIEEDYKSKLQESVQALYRELPIYRVIGEEGPMHARKFIAEVIIKGRSLGTGSGFSKKEAEQYAAKEALSKLHNLEKEGINNGSSKSVCKI
ncbi:MAG: ribonuclease III [bacterium]|nr:ribonuclease III [bacterium]